MDAGLLWGEIHSLWKSETIKTAAMHEVKLRWNSLWKSKIIDNDAAMYGHESLVHRPWSWLRPDKQEDNWERVVGQVGPNLFHFVAITKEGKIFWLISPRKVKCTLDDGIKDGKMQFCQLIFFLLFQGWQGSDICQPRCCLHCALEQGYEAVKLNKYIS